MNTIKDYYTTLHDWEIKIPAGTHVTHRTACGIDPKYHFATMGQIKGAGGNWRFIHSSDFIHHDFVHTGINVPVDYVYKIKLVVADGHTLGYIDPRLPDTLQILHASILRGATFQVLPESTYVKGRDIRLATPKDFEDFRVSMVGYTPDLYEFATE